VIDINVSRRAHANRMESVKITSYEKFFHSGAHHVKQAIYTRG
jgi:hypothetical protein